MITPSVADFSSENESCNVIEDTDDFTLWLLSFERDLVSQKVCRNMEKYPKSRGVEVVVAGGFNNIKTVFVDLHTNTNTPSLCLHIQRIMGWRDRGGNYLNIFAIISKYLHQTSQIYFALSGRWRAAWRKYWIDTKAQNYWSMCFVLHLWTNKVSVVLFFILMLFCRSYCTWASISFVCLYLPVLVYICTFCLNLYSLHCDQNLCIVYFVHLVIW